MSAIVRQLLDDEEHKIYPITRSKAVYMPNGRATLDVILADMQDGDTDIVFNSDGTITTTLASGNAITTSFLEDGNIEERCVDLEGEEVYTKTTTFNEDGSISIRVVYPEVD